MGKAYIEPYLFFNGCCEQAIEFYRKAVGASVDFMMRYKESPDAPPPGRVPANWDEKIMHASVRIGGALIMMSDGCETSPKFAGFSLSLSLSSEAEVHRTFAALAEGGEVQMPVMKTFWSPCFGMVVDRFGVGWMVTVAADRPK